MKFEDLETSIMTYINREFCRKLEDWRKWALPLAVRMYLPTLKKKYCDNFHILKSSGLVLDDGTICIDDVYKYLNEIARETGNIVCNIPAMGQVTFSSSDIDSLYQIIKQEEQSRSVLPTSPPTVTPSVVQNNIIS